MKGGQLGPVDEEPVCWLVNLHRFQQQVIVLVGLFAGKKEFSLPVGAEVFRRIADSPTLNARTIDSSLVQILPRRLGLPVIPF